MGNRLSRITTKTGDKGSTGLADGSRVDKDDIIIETLGAIDELNSFIGLLLSEMPLVKPANDIDHLSLFNKIQHQLFDLGGEISLPDHAIITEKDVLFLEDQLNKLNKQLPPLKEFVLPNGNKPSCLCHVARTVCRRAERRMTSLAKTRPGNPFSLIYLNRLSDFLFVFSRFLNTQNGSPEELWKNK